MLSHNYTFLKTTYFTLLVVLMFHSTDGIAQNDTLRDDPNYITVEEAISIAKDEKMYQDPAGAGLDVAPVLTVMSENSVAWKIRSYVTYYSKKGECRKTNGCTVIREYFIWINAETGAVIKKDSVDTFIPNYE